jgi:hypothetical protein
VLDLVSCLKRTVGIWVFVCFVVQYSVLVDLEGQCAAVVVSREVGWWSKLRFKKLLLRSGSKCSAGPNSKSLKAARELASGGSIGGDDPQGALRKWIDKPSPFFNAMEGIVTG